MKLKKLWLIAQAVLGIAIVPTILASCASLEQKTEGSLTPPPPTSDGRETVTPQKPEPEKPIDPAPVPPVDPNPVPPVEPSPPTEPTVPTPPITPPSDNSKVFTFIYRNIQGGNLNERYYVKSPDGITILRAKKNSTWFFNWTLPWGNDPSCNQLGNFNILAHQIVVNSIIEYNV